MSTTTYPASFFIKKSYFEGDHTSYAWQKCNGVILSETACFYTIQEGNDKARKVKKTNVSFTNPEEQVEVAPQPEIAQAIVAELVAARTAELVAEVEPTTTYSLDQIVNGYHQLNESGLTRAEVASYLRGGYGSPSTFTVREYFGEDLVSTQSGMTWLEGFDAEDFKTLKPAPSSANDKRKQKGLQYKASILTAGGWELKTGGFTGSLPDVVAWVTEHVPTCAPYLKIYRGLKETGGMWSACYPTEAMQPVAVIISSVQAIQLA
jgi:hypothetical protein